MRKTSLPPALFAAIVVASAALPARSARAEDAPGIASDASLAPLLAGLARHAEQFEQMKKRGSYTLSGRLEQLDRSGNVDGTKEMVLRVTATPAKRLTEVIKYIEDGTDKTSEARLKEEKRKAEPPKPADKRPMSDIHLPFLASEQPRYVFSIVGRDLQRSQTRVAFQAKVPAEDAYHGSAWVDDSTGDILTLGISPTKNPTFIDHIGVTIRFDLQTPLGRAPSSFTVDAQGGFLVVHKHYRGTATLSDPKIAF